MTREEYIVNSILICKKGKKIINFEITEDLDNEIKRKAKELGLSKRGFMRRALYAACCFIDFDSDFVPYITERTQRGIDK